MEKSSTTRMISEVSIVLINMFQLLQALSFIKDAPESGSWNSDVSDFFTFTKHIALRYSDDNYKLFYIISCIACAVTLVLYMLLSDYIHKLNKRNDVSLYLILFFEYIVFGLGFIPMISRFVEVQICNTNLDIDTWSSVSCFDNDQLALLEIGFVCISIAFIMNSVIFPSLKYERNSVEKLWANESYIEGFFYLILIGVASLLGFIKLPSVGIILCSAALAYALVLECYESIIVASSRCGVLSALIWAFAAAYVLKNDNNGGNTMIKLLIIGYSIGFLIRFIKSFIIKREKKSVIPVVKGTN